MEDRYRVVLANPEVIPAGGPITIEPATLTAGNGVAVDLPVPIWDADGVTFQTAIRFPVFVDVGDLRIYRFPPGTPVTLSQRQPPTATLTLPNPFPALPAAAPVPLRRMPAAASMVPRSRASSNASDPGPPHGGRRKSRRSKKSKKSRKSRRRH